MGNTHEVWMTEALSLVTVNDTSIQKPKLKAVRSFKCSRWIKKFLFKNIILRKPIWKTYLKFKGLNREVVKNY